MEGRIGQLHCRYKIIGRRYAGAAPLILDRLARESIAESYAAALGRVLGDSPEVHVARRVEAPMLYVQEAALSDPRFARRWGERLAGTVLRRIANRDADDENLISFADQAEYVARFITDLLAGRAWDRWFYGAFESLRPLSLVEALRRVLMDNREHLSAILACLHREGSLNKTLSSLDRGSLRAIWEEGLPATPISSSSAQGESLRPIFANALQLVDRLELWEQPRRDSESMFQEYLASTPLEADWRDRRGLSAAVFDVLSFFALRGFLRRMIAPPGEDFLALLDRTLADYDWADSDWLRSSLLEMLPRPGAHRTAIPGSMPRTDEAGVDLHGSNRRPAGHRAESRGSMARPDESGSDLPVLPPGSIRETDLPLRPPQRGATPRQRQLLADLAAALGRADPLTDFSEAEIPANALRLYAALVAHAPRWADDAAATGMIRNLLAAWALLRQSDSIAHAIRGSLKGDLAGALRTLPEPKRREAEPAFKFLSALGEPALVLLKRFASIDRQASAADVAAIREAGVESSYAGISLLLRAAADARLHALIEEARFPASDSLTRFAAVFLALGLRWGGEAATQSPIDEGLSLMAGLPRPPAFDDLIAAWSTTTEADCARFQSALLGVLAGQRLARMSTMHLFRITIEDGREALVAGDETATLWLLARVIAPDAPVAPIIHDMLDAWSAAAGRMPSAVVADKSLAADLPPECGELIVTSGDGPALHHAGGTALLDALRALGQGRLGLPEVDLTVALAAAALLRMWARWLRQFADSSVPYLLDNFIHRQGRVSLGDDALRVELDRRPLDILIEMAGYAADLDRVAWLGGRSVRFRMRGDS